MARPPSGWKRGSVPAKVGRQADFRGRLPRYWGRLSSPRELVEHDRCPKKQKVEFKICDANECARNEIRVKRELGHLCVAGDVAVLWMVTPTVSKLPEGKQRADERP